MVVKWGCKSQWCGTTCNNTKKIGEKKKGKKKKLIYGAVRCGAAS
jgi:hypothetical protein